MFQSISNLTIWTHHGDFSDLNNTFTFAFVFVFVSSPSQFFTPINLLETLRETSFLHNEANNVSISMGAKEFFPAPTQHSKCEMWYTICDSLWNKEIKNDLQTDNNQ